MSNDLRKAFSWGILLLLIGVGLWQIYSGNIGFGIGLTTGVIGAAIGKHIKQKKIKKLQAQGLNPYDERAYFIAGKSSYAALSTAVVISALFIIIGSIAGPQITVNPYNFLGNCLALLVLIYIGFYYYFSKKA